MSTFAPFLVEFERAVRVLVARPGDALNPLVFLMVVVALVPLGIGPERELLERFAPGFIWIAALLANLSALDTLFRRDLEDGVLTQLLLLSPAPWQCVLARLFVHWLATGLAIVLLTPLLALWLQLPLARLPMLATTLLLGTPLLTLLGGVGAAITAGLPRAGVLLSILIAPLYAPVLILGVGAIELADSGVQASGALLWLAALLSIGLTLAPATVVLALRINVEG